MNLSDPDWYYGLTISAVILTWLWMLCKDMPKPRKLKPWQERRPEESWLLNRPEQQRIAFLEEELERLRSERGYGRE